MELILIIVVLVLLFGGGGGSGVAVEVIGDQRRLNAQEGAAGTPRRLVACHSRQRVPSDLRRASYP